MSVIILTWDEGEKVYIVTDDSGRQKFFDTVSEADSWAEDNTGILSDFQRIVDLDD